MEVNMDEKKNTKEINENLNIEGHNKDLQSEKAAASEKSAVKDKNAVKKSDRPKAKKQNSIKKAKKTDKSKKKSEKGSAKRPSVKKEKSPVGNKQNPDSKGTEAVRKKPKPPKKASSIKKLKAIRPKGKNVAKFLKVNKTSIIALLAIVVLLILAFLFNSHNVIKIGEKQVMFSKEYSMSSKADFHVSGENIFYVSKDGMLFLDKRGEALWSDTFTMSAPYMLCDGEYAAVADKSSKTINVYDKSGRLYRISAAGPITTFAINPIGCCAVVCKVNDDYRVDVYSNTGETMFECARASKDGIPLGIDLSDDGTVAALTLVNYNDIKINSSVLFYYTVKSDAQAAESSDGLISAIEVPEAIAGIVRFMPDKYCLVASNKSLMYIGSSGKGDGSFNKQWEMVFKNYITAFDIVKNKEIALCFGEAVSVTDEEAIAEENTIHWYNLKGREIGSAKADGRITDISSSDKGTIITVDKEFTAYTSRGKELWKYNALQNVSSMQFYNSEDRVILITPTSMQLLDVKKGVTMQEEETDAQIPEVTDDSEKEPAEENSEESMDKEAPEDNADSEE